MKATQQRMRDLADATELQWDSKDDDRLFYDSEAIFVYCNLLTEEQYDRMEAEMGAAEIKGEGYTVYAWNDASGYEYWKRQGEMDDSNYIQVTASVTDPHAVDPKKLKRDVERVFSKLCHWHNVDEHYSHKMARAEA